MLYCLLFVQGKAYWLYYKFTSHRVEQFGNYTSSFILNLRILIYRERHVNYLNNLYYIFGRVWLIKFVAIDLLVILI